MQNPRVSVLTATYNGSRFLPAAIESVLAQTFEDFEYIVVDDALTDDSTSIVAQYATRDPRLRMIRNATNLNPAGALNVGLAQARGEYIAILDHDDIALPHRLAEEVAFLDTHMEMGAVGSQVKIIDETGTPKTHFSYPSDPDTARWFLYFGTPILHSTAMYRRHLLEEIGGYSVRHPYICDYELLMRLADRTQFSNLPGTLGYYRGSDGQVSRNKRIPQEGQVLLLQYAMVRRWLGLHLPLTEYGLLRNWLTTRRAPEEAEVAANVMDLLATMGKRHLEVTGLTVQSAPDLFIAMAQHWLTLAHSLYGVHRALARRCWQAAIELDGNLLQRPETWRRLRRRPENAEPTGIPELVTGTAQTRRQ